MILPTIHLNGTSKHELIHPLEHAIMMFDAAYEALKQTAPNGRDYYPQGPDALSAATDAHMGRLRRLDAIKAEIDALIVGIDAQGE